RDLQPPRRDLGHRRLRGLRPRPADGPHGRRLPLALQSRAQRADDGRQLERMPAGAAPPDAGDGGLLRPPAAGLPAARQASPRRDPGLSQDALAAPASLDAFLRLPAAVYRGDPHYNATPRKDLLASLKRPEFDGRQRALVVMEGGEPVARMVAR